MAWCPTCYGIFDDEEDVCPQCGEGLLEGTPCEAADDPSISPVAARGPAFDPTESTEDYEAGGEAV